MPHQSPSLTWIPMNTLLRWFVSYVLSSSSSSSWAEWWQFICLYLLFACPLHPIQCHKELWCSLYSKIHHKGFLIYSLQIKTDFYLKLKRTGIILNICLLSEVWLIGCWVSFFSLSGESSDAASSQSVSIRHLQPERHRGSVCEAAQRDPGQKLRQLFRVLWEVGAGGTRQQTVQRDGGKQEVLWVPTRWCTLAYWFRISSIIFFNCKMIELIQFTFFLLQWKMWAVL